MYPGTRGLGWVDQLPEHLANKTKMHLKPKKMNSKSLEYEDVLYFDLQPPWQVPGVSSYGMEADPLRFLYLKDECFLMTDRCDKNISLIMKNSRSVTLTSRSVGRWGMGMEQGEILDPYLTSGKVSTRSINRFKSYPLL